MAEQLCHHLKTSHADLLLAQFYLSSKCLFNSQPEPVQWAHFYAHSDAELVLQVFAASLPPLERISFLEAQKAHQMHLATNIDRIRKKDPLINATFLMEQGIPPGKQLGQLLKEAERISINQTIHNQNELLALLKQSPLWPHNN